MLRIAAFGKRLSPVALALATACTGVSSLPGGSSGPGAGGTSGGGTGTGGSSGAPSIGTVVPTLDLDPGRATMRRLNVAEYNNTARDLLGTTGRPADKFPGDDVNHGFDTLGDALTISDFFVEQAETAAGALIDELLARPAADPVRTRIVSCTPTAANLATCLPQILGPFMKSAYRRPVTPAEIADTVALGTAVAQTSGGPARGLNAALKSVLLSPYFLFHVEQGAADSGAATPLDDHALASRLSYFLWSSMPDAALTQAADGATLKAGGAPLTAQIDRMLADAKAQAFIDNFGGQWLSTREVSGFSPDPMLFPSVDQGLLDAIPQETSLFFKGLLSGNKPLTDLVLADYTFVNARLAQHYGLPAAQPAFAQVSLAGSGRGGILTQETFLTTTSQPNRTSPVKRGNWVLEHLLCDPPPSPPPDVPQLPAFVPGSGLTGRAYLEQHVTNKYCASCHTGIDPIGFAFEHFDAVGAYRATDNGQTIDDVGELPDGTTFAGPAELSRWVAGDVRFARCLTKQMLTYAVGRPFDTAPAVAYAAGVAEPLRAGGTWANLVRAVATSQAFLTRRGEGP